MFRNILRLSAIALMLSATGIGAQERPIFFKLKVPTDATVEIDKYKTTSTGSVRRYETPAVPTGKEYTYAVKVTSGGKAAEKTIKISHTESTIDLTADFATATAIKPMPTPTPKGLKPGPVKAGFVTYDDKGRHWIFREGSKEHDAFLKDGDLAKHVVRPVAGPGGVTLKAPDSETIEAYLTQVDGYETLIKDGRLWVFKKGSKEFDAYKKDNDLAKHVIRVNAGPLGMTVKAPDEATLDGYLKAVGK